MNNIFEYAPKELVMDAFLCWCFNFFNSEDAKEKEFSVSLVNFIYGLKYKRKKINVKKLEVKRQHLKSKIDVYVKITTEEGKVIHFIFENKLYTSPHSNQLIRHIKEVEEIKEKNDEKIYIYFKLGYRYAEDMKDNFSAFRFGKSAKEKEKLEKYIPKLKEYVELDRKQFIEFLGKNKLESDTFKMYFQYIKDIDDYYEKLKELISVNRVLTEEERNRVFRSPVGGYEIFEKLRRKSDMNLRIRKGSNPDGRPWTQLDIKWEEVNSNWKGLFWRIDWRNNKKKKSGDSFTPYLRLNMYNDNMPDEKDNGYHKKCKEIFKELSNEYTKINFSEPHGIGKKEREVGILFFENINTIPNVIEEMSKFTGKFIERIKDEKAFYNFE